MVSELTSSPLPSNSPLASLSIIGVGPPAPAQESTNVYSLACFKPPRLEISILLACFAGDPFFDVEVFQVLAKARWE